METLNEVNTLNPLTLKNSPLSVIITVTWLRIKSGVQHLYCSKSYWYKTIQTSWKPNTWSLKLYGLNHKCSVLCSAFHLFLRNDCCFDTRLHNFGKEVSRKMVIHNTSFLLEIRDFDYK